MFDIEIEVLYNTNTSPLLLRGQGARRYQAASAFFKRPKTIKVKLEGGKMKTFVYVDGFNLYYGAVKGTPYKWLNILTLSKLLLPRNDIIKIKYFTALVTARPGDPDQPNRQQIYLRALRTLPNLEINFWSILGACNYHARSRKSSWKNPIFTSIEDRRKRL